MNSESDIRRIKTTLLLPPERYFPHCQGVHELRIIRLAFSRCLDFTTTKVEDE